MDTIPTEGFDVALTLTDHIEHLPDRESPSPLDTTLCTLTPGPGDHFDLVRMPAHSAVTTNDLLTTQSEEDPV